MKFIMNINTNISILCFLSYIQNTAQNPNISSMGAKSEGFDPCPDSILLSIVYAYITSLLSQNPIPIYLSLSRRPSVQASSSISASYGYPTSNPNTLCRAFSFQYYAHASGSALEDKCSPAKVSIGTYIWLLTAYSSIFLYLPLPEASQCCPTLFECLPRPISSTLHCKAGAIPSSHGQNGSSDSPGCLKPHRPSPISSCLLFSTPCCATRRCLVTSS